jgi:hypothetical protein
MALPAILAAIWKYRTVIGIVVMLAGAGGYILKVKHDAYQDGRQRGYAEATAKCEKEKLAMELANQKAISDAGKVLIEKERELIEQETRIDDLQLALDLAADADPDAAHCGLGAPSVRRLQALR